MPSKIDPEERETTQHLIDDFAVDDTITVERVYKESWKKFNDLEEDIYFLLGIYEQVFNRKSPFLKSLPKWIHKTIYDGLYVNAGQYRLTSDPGGGKVFFGPQHAQMREQKFRGNSPKNIERDVAKALEYFDLRDYDPLMRCLKFYQEFVFIHPFYDGNGRIGRLIANIYLTGYGLLLLWNEFDSKTKFIDKLNWCHNSQSDESYQVLYNFVKKHLYSLAKFEDLDED